jgi:hypothetical protein
MGLSASKIFHKKMLFSLLRSNCEFFENDTGIYISGVSTQGNKWRVVDCDFEEMANQAFKSTNGTGTQIQRSRTIRFDRFFRLEKIGLIDLRSQMEGRNRYTID